ncbi:MAG TPA: hypothetical protein VGF19_16380 [Candidatus Acidoferrum sp.]|jgi:hypothetical protein
MFSFSFTVMLAAFSVCTQFVVFLRWMHRRMRDDEIHRAFVRDLAIRHLPSIYRALHTIAEQQGITLEETPIVNFVDFRGGRPLL